MLNESIEKVLFEELSCCYVDDYYLNAERLIIIKKFPLDYIENLFVQYVCPINNKRLYLGHWGWIEVDIDDIWSEYLEMKKEPDSFMLSIKQKWRVFCYRKDWERLEKALVGEF